MSITTRHAHRPPMDDAGMKPPALQHNGNKRRQARSRCLRPTRVSLSTDSKVPSARYIHRIFSNLDLGWRPADSPLFLEALELDLLGFLGPLLHKLIDLRLAQAAIGELLHGRQWEE